MRTGTTRAALAVRPSPFSHMLYHAALIVLRQAEDAFRASDIGETDDAVWLFLACLITA